MDGQYPITDCDIEEYIRRGRRYVAIRYGRQSYFQELFDYVPEATWSILLKYDPARGELSHFFSRCISRVITCYLRKYLISATGNVRPHARAISISSFQGWDSLRTCQNTGPNMLLRQRLEGMISGLKPRSAELVRLYFFEDWDYNEIAREYNLTRWGVYLSIQKSLLRLRKMMKGAAV